MKSIPMISVQLVHILGPMKGEIQEILDPEISIGRHPSCQVRFPKDMAVISRYHARIVREGNRFKLIDQSANGTFLNGQQVTEAFLKNGDVLMFTDGGPKVSFLTKVIEGRVEADEPPLKAEVAPQAAAAGPAVSAPSPPPQQPQPAPRKEVSVQRVQVPLIIQYGPTLRSFKELPVTIGRNPACDFVVDHPALLDHHAQIFFSRDQYWVKDLTGKQLVRVNGLPIELQAPLTPDNQLSLSATGPSFRFLGAGRLAEIEDSMKKTSTLETPPEPEAGGPAEKPPPKSPKRAGGFVKKIFQR
jgi:pSer/pThr/pTyr-binding forkhead associated (FHA) protein